MEKISDLFFWRKKEYVRRKIVSMMFKGQNSGVLDESSRRMIENILDFTSILVREIMIPRTDIVAVNADDELQTIMQVITEARFTRLPVYQGSIDKIIGILNIKDLLNVWSTGITKSALLSNLTRPYYIPETKNAHLLFYEFKNNKKHIAIVIDEYGGTSGLVTLEDLLEEIVGDIRDEHEENADSEDIMRVSENIIVVDGRTEIEKIEDYLKIGLEKGRYETISGLILDTIRKIPHPGEKYQIQRMEITIENADERTIRKVRIKKLEHEASDKE